MASLPPVSNEVVNVAGNLVSKAQLQSLYKQIAEHPVLSKASPELIDRSVMQALNNHRSGRMYLEGKEEIAAHGQRFVRDGIDFVESAFNKIVGKAEAVVRRTAPRTASAESTRGMAILKTGLTNLHESPRASAFGHLNNNQKVTMGISAMLAAGSAIGAVDALSKIKTTQADGTNQFHPTHIGLALVQGLLAVGLGYAAHQQYHGRF